MEIRVRASGGESLDRLARRLRRAGEGFQRRMTQAVLAEAQPALLEVRTAWLGVEVESSRGGSEATTRLRERTAAATLATPLGRGVRFEVESEAVDPAYGRTLTFGLDGLNRWRHPVFGNRHRWETQKGEEVFLSTLRAHEGRYRARLERELERVAREIEG